MKNYKIIKKIIICKAIRHSNSGMTTMVGDREFKRLFISNRSGNVFIYDISSPVPNLLNVLTSQLKGAIRGM